MDPNNLRFLYQGVDPSKAAVEYYQLPYQLGLLRSSDTPPDTTDDDPDNTASVCEGSTQQGTESIADFDDAPRERRRGLHSQLLQSPKGDDRPHPKWKRYVVPFSAFQYPGWGVNAEYAGVMMGLVFDSAGPDFDVWVDEIQFYADDAPDGTDGTAGAGGSADANDR